MRILIAIDSFKESMSSQKAGLFFQKGLKKAHKSLKSDILVISDGGEGFVESLIHKGGKLGIKRVSGPLSQPVQASFGLTKSGDAVIEMAQASGLELVPVNKRDPMKTTTHGTGELIGAALDKGAKTIYVGIGGSATVDGGIGMAAALGVKFYDKRDRLIKGKLCGGDLSAIESMDVSGLKMAGKKGGKLAKFVIACDVNNKLCGPKGAAAVFGPQKGASAKSVKILELGLKNLSKVIKKSTGKSVLSLVGGGAAGGIGAMLYALYGAQMKPGIDIVMDQIGFDGHLAKADLVVTGEGRIDSQSAGGKVISGIAARAKKKGIPVLALGGAVLPGNLAELHKAGITSALSISPGPGDLASAIANGPAHMESMGEQIGRLIGAIQS